jgi:uncharacterized metal-binding protein
MPSGKTHDAITFLFTAPVFAGAFSVSRSGPVALAVAGAFLFGGLMFGPDLDTVSKQASRWGIFRPLWYPYRVCFKHRSRWSHGLVFGTLFRVIYFLGAVTVMTFATAYAASSILGTDLPDAFAFVREWRTVGAFIESEFGSEILPAVFVGMWAGAASHTLTDIAGTFVKTGRVGEFL